MTSEILLIDDEKDIRFAVHEILKENNFFVREADTVEKALSEIKKKLPDLVILDVLLDEKNRDGIHILKFIKSLDADLPVIMISGHANIQIAVDSIKHGAFEFLEKPFNKDRLLNYVNIAIETSYLKKENKSLKKYLYSYKELIGWSSTIVKLRNAIDKFSKTDSRILISGPAGSGSGGPAQGVAGHLMTRPDTLHLFLGDEPVGWVHDAAPLTFEYTPAWLQRQPARPVAAAARRTALRTGPAAHAAAAGGAGQRGRRCGPPQPVARRRRCGTP